MVTQKEPPIPDAKVDSGANQVLLSVKEDPEANISFWLRPNWHQMDLDHHQCEATLPTTL